VLGDPDRADIAVENCLFSASHHVTTFDCEGAFRSWLVRIALDQALAILHGRSIREHRRDWSPQEQGKSVALMVMKCNSRFSSVVAPAVEAIARVDLSDLADRPGVATPSQILTIIGILLSYPPALHPASNSVDGLCIAISDAALTAASDGTSGEVELRRVDNLVDKRLGTLSRP
jgi:hypothetical protein